MRALRLLVLLWAALIPLLSVGQTPGLTRGAADQRYAKFSTVRTSGISVVASDLNALHNSSRQVPGADLGAIPNTTTYRLAHALVADAADLRFTYVNGYWGASGGAPNQNWITVDASLEPKSPLGATVQDQARIPLLFGGEPRLYLGPGGVTTSDGTGWGGKRGDVFFERVAPSVDAINNPPAAPTIVGTTGGFMTTSTTYYVAITSVTARFETFCSPASSVAIGTNTAITVTSPTAALSGGSLAGQSYRVYCSTNSAGPWFAVSGPIPVGENYTILKNPPSGALGTNPGVPQVSPRTVMGIPLGFWTQGGTAFFGINNGEGKATGHLVYNGGSSDTTTDTTSVCYSASVIQGYVKGGVLPSYYLSTDSLGWGQGDDGYRANAGGWIERGMRGDTALAYTPGLVPRYAYLVDGIPGEKLSWRVDKAGNAYRDRLSSMFTVYVNELGTNDIVAGASLSTIQIEILQLAQMAQAREQFFIDCTYIPRVSSTDGMLTVAGQTPVTGESVRKAKNSWDRSTATVGTVATNESLGTGNGSTKSFTCAQAFKEGTEVVTVAGVAKTAGADYNYTLEAYVGGARYANGITFASAPANSAAVAQSYTSVPGFVAACGGASKASYWDPASKVECNSAGVLTLNGGFFLPAIVDFDYPAATWTATSTSLTINSGATFTATSVATSGFTVTRTPGMMGYVAMVQDSNSVYATLPVQYNSSTVLTSVTKWYRPDQTLPTQYTPNATTGTGFKIGRWVSNDGTHLAGYGAMLAAAAVDLSKG